MYQKISYNITSNLIKIFTHENILYIKRKEELSQMWYSIQHNRSWITKKKMIPKTSFIPNCLIKWKNIFLIPLYFQYIPERENRIILPTLIELKYLQKIPKIDRIFKYIIPRCIKIFFCSLLFKRLIFNRNTRIIESEIIRCFWSFENHTILA